MRVITPPAPRTRHARGGTRAAAIETVGLAASTFVILCGVLLCYAGLRHSFATLDAERSRGAIIHLRELRNWTDLAPRLTMFESRSERDAVARALYRRAMADTPPLDHVGDLATVTIPATDVRNDRRLVELNLRLDRHPQLKAVPVFGPGDLSALKSGLIVRGPDEFTAAVRTALIIFFAAFWGVHLARRLRGADHEPVILPVLLMLSGLGLIAMIGLRDPLRDTILASRFVIGVAGGAAVLAAVSFIDFEASPLRRAVTAPLSVALALAVLLLALGSGPGASGAKVNLFGVQPVEAIRVVVIFALAAYFARRLEFLRELSEPAAISRSWLRVVNVPRLKDVAPVIVSMSFVLVFFFLQKDLGPALVLSFVFLALYGIARGRVALVVVGIGMLLVAFAAAYQIGFPATVRQRVAIWLNPWQNATAGGDQIAQGLWAMATGATAGTGLGLGDPQLIPAGHTDFVIAALGEELGFIGLMAVVLLYVLLFWRCLRVAIRAPGDFTALLSIGIALGLIVQAFVIASGIVGILPLTGVVTPFLSYGRSSMLANFAGVGIVLAVAGRAGAVREHLVMPFRVLAWVLGAVAVAVIGRAGWIQVVQADSLAAASSLTEQADGALRFQYNPRLLAVAHSIERGTIYDRNGLPLATTRPAERDAVARTYQAAGIPAPDRCAAETPRCYPLGGLAFHVLGDATYQTNWAARNSSFIERDSDAQLKGFDDRAQAVDVRHSRTGAVERTVRRDYRELVPLLRNRYTLNAPAVRELLSRNRDVRSSVDARLQVRAAAALQRRMEAGGYARGAAVVLDADTGDVLASVSYPWPRPADLKLRDPAKAGSEEADRLFDRTRYGLYPPGSTFKLLVAAAALRTNHQHETFACIRLPDGRVGNYVAGTTRPVRDDPMDTSPHGSVDLHRGLVVSCNAYFAQLAIRIGPEAFMEAASMFQIDVSQPPTAAALRRTLAHAGYGQGQVVVSPTKVARLAAAISTRGRVPPAQWIVGGGEAAAPEPQLLPAADAALLSRYMRDVVVSGTGRALAANATPIAGKTGTAEIATGRAHSWFAGFAPYGGGAQRRIAFAVVIENAGYGARAAAPLAGDLVTAARELGVIR